MAEELTTFYAGYIERPLVACEALSVFPTQKAVEDIFEVGDRIHGLVECCSGRIPQGSSVHRKGKKA